MSSLRCNLFSPFHSTLLLCPSSYCSRYTQETTHAATMRPALIFRTFVCLFFAFPGFGWWGTGHRAIARVAAARLLPAAQARVAALLQVKNTTSSVADAMAAASTWADDVKAQSHTGRWHFIDIALEDSRDDLPKRCPHRDCITARIHLFEEEISSGRDAVRAHHVKALKYLIHLIGDVHQPLHAASDADQGGNCEQITPFGDARNLHALWDGGFVRAIDPSDIRLARKLDLYIRRLEPEVVKNWSSGTAEAWAWESHEIAQKVIYGRLHIPLEPVLFPKSCDDAPIEIRTFRPAVDSLYVNDMKPVVRDQLAKAGLRLAAVLNRTLH
jgi:nuclease S1